MSNTNRNQNQKNETTRAIFRRMVCSCRKRTQPALQNYKRTDRRCRFSNNISDINNNLSKMEKIKTIYYNEENDIMFQEYNFVSEAPVIGDWMYWHTLNWEVENRNFNFDLKQLEIFCKQV